MELSSNVRFVHGDATHLPFGSASFDATLGIQAAMSVPVKDALYAGARRVLKPVRIPAVYDVLQGEGGPVISSMPRTRDPSISALVTPDGLRRLCSTVARFFETLLWWKPWRS